MTDEIQESPFLDGDKFYKTVDKFVKDEGITYIEATIKACEFYMVDPEDIGKLKLVNLVLKDKLHTEGVAEGYLKKEAQLPI